MSILSAATVRSALETCRPILRCSPNIRQREGQYVGNSQIRKGQKLAARRHRRISTKPEGWQSTTLPRRIRSGRTGNSDWAEEIASTRRRESRAVAGRPNSSHKWTRVRIGSDTSLPIPTEGLKPIAVNKHKISSPIRQRHVLPSMNIEYS